ncbi:MAG: heparinase II/III domain-containing protein, partial [Candidatus Latescibacterota bacterium]
NACRDTLYGDCWQALIYTLQGDLHFPPSADSYQSTTISVSFADLLTLAYPTNTHIALLKELAAKDPSEGADQAIFNRDPHFANQTAPPLNLPDVVFPYLSQGYLHTGDDGRKSLVSLNAADHANHHHIDGLGLYYWKDGRELLSDLGYLWDHPDKYQTARTGAHNLVMIDGKDQLSRGRHGTFHLFSVTPTIKAMEASSDGYGSESTYQRTLVQIDHGSAGSYLLDIFRASGGQTADYIFHGPTNTYQVNGLNLKSSQPVNFGENGLDLTDLHHAQQQNPWHISYTYDDGYTFEAFAPGSANESIFIGNGWGQRDHRNTDVGATLPYVIRRVEGQNRKDIFVSAFVGNQGKQTLVKSIQVHPLPSNAPQDAIAIAVQTAHGTDIVISQLQTTPITLSTEVGDITTDARLATLLINNGSPSSASLTGGTNLSTTNIELTAPNATLSRRILSNESLNGNSYFDLDSNLPHIQNLQGQTLFAIDDTNKHGYPIRHIEPTNTGCRVFTKHNHQGFEARLFDAPSIHATSSRYIPNP